MRKNIRTKSRSYRGFKIVLQSDDRYDVVVDDDPIAENFEEISLAMSWIDETQLTK